MVRSKYIADQAVEAARLSVLNAAEAERRAMAAKQEAEGLNNCFVVQTGKEVAHEGYKAAHAGQNATVVGQQAAVWEDPNLPPQDAIRQLEYITRLIDDVVDKAAEVIYSAALIAQDFDREGLLSKEEKKLFSEEEEKLYKKSAKGCTDHPMASQTKTLLDRTEKQTALKFQVHLSTRKLANILANQGMPKSEKFQNMMKEANDIFTAIEKLEEPEELPKLLLKLEKLEEFEKILVFKLKDSSRTSAEVL